MALNSTKNKIIAEDKIWSDEIPAVEDNKTTMVKGYNNIFQELFNRVKNLRTTFLNRNISAGNGLQGGGNLSTDRGLSVKAKDISIVVESAGISVNKTDMLNISNSGILASSKAIKTVNDKLETHKGRIDNPHSVSKTQVGLGSVNNWVATSSITDASTTKYSTAAAVKSTNDNIESHKVRKDNPHGVSKAQVGLSNVLNYPPSDQYKSLDGDGNKFSLQKSLKLMYEELKNELKNKSLIGEPVVTLCNTLPNNIEFAWCNGRQLKKRDYPDLWARVESTVIEAIEKVSRGEMIYGNTYFGWYQGDTDEYFRVPDLNSKGNFLRPKSNLFSGVFESDSFRLHKHNLTMSNSGGHNHSLSIVNSGAHKHTVYVSNHTYGGGGADKPVADPYTGDTSNYSTDRPFVGNTGAHTHTIKQGSAGDHSHSITMHDTGGEETRPKNIAVKYYCRIK